VILWILIGLGLLFVGGESLVRGSVAAARQLGVSPLLIGITLVGFGTSTPELVTSLEAAFKGSPGIAVGNVVGSSIANIFLILGVAAVIMPIACNPRAIYRDASVTLLAALACAGAVVKGTISAGTGLIFMALLVLYIVTTYLHDRKVPDAAAALHRHDADLAAAPMALGPSLLLAVVGIALTVIGAGLLVDNSIVLARTLGISDTIIGLTLVAIGTSLPELATSIVASFRRHGDIALGNVLGSNIYNVFGILGVTAAVHPLTVPDEIARLDIWVMLAATLLLLLFAFSGSRLSRAEGAIFLAAYAVYIAYLAWSAVAST